MGCGIAKGNQEELQTMQINGQKIGIEPRKKREGTNSQPSTVHAQSTPTSVSSDEGKDIKKCVEVQAVELPNDGKEEDELRKPAQFPVKELKKKALNGSISKSKQKKKHEEEETLNPDPEKGDSLHEIIEDINLNCNKDSENLQENVVNLVNKYGIHHLLILLQQSGNTMEVAEANIALIISVISISCTIPKIRAQIVKRGGTRVIINLLHKHSENPDILILILSALYALGKKDKKMSLMFRLDGGITEILFGIKRHNTNVEYLKHSCRLLAILSTRNANNISLLLKEHAVNKIFGLVTQHADDIGLLAVCFNVLCNIAKSSEVNARIFLKQFEGGPQTILGMLEAYIEHEDIVAFILTILKSLAVAHTKNVIKSALPLLHRLIDIYHEHPGIVHLICTTVWKISASTRSPIPKGIGYSFAFQNLENAIQPEVEDPEIVENVEAEISEEEKVSNSEDDDDADEDADENIEDGNENGAEEINPLEEPVADKETPNEVNALEIMKWFPELFEDLELHDKGNNNNETIDSNVYSAVKTFSQSPPDHLRYIPPQPEPCLIGTDVKRLTLQMMMHDLQLMQQTQSTRIVFDCLEQEIVDRRQEDLEFESRFECGNCRRVVWISESEYDIITNTDVNSTSHTQWFYFAIRNMKLGLTYKFNIINMEKPTSEFNNGMKVLFYSNKMAEDQQIGWHRVGENIVYYRNQYFTKLPGKVKNYFTLTFSFQFPYENDVCYFASCYPYSKHLLDLENDPSMKSKLRRSVLCKTLAGNSCDLLTITSFPCDPQNIRAKPCVVLTARVHPGESQSSWMMKGIIDFLVGDSLEAQQLRDTLVFKIIPILNIDGVIMGNHRCSLAGVDLNRQWLSPSPDIHPTIYNAKKLVAQILADREIILFADLHGHFRKKNVFMYGCSNDRDTENRLKEHFFPYLLSQRDPNFSYNDSNFKVTRSKRSCGRVVIGKGMGVTNSYTMEASFCGMDIGPNKFCHLDIGMLEEIGKNLQLTILDYLQLHQTQREQIYENISKRIESEEGTNPKKRLKKKPKKNKPPKE